MRSNARRSATPVDDQLAVLPGLAPRSLRSLRRPSDRRHRHAGEAVPEDLRRRRQPGGRPGRPGRASGDFAKAKFDCEYDAYISLDFPTIAEINAARAGGTNEGFEEVCGPIPAEKYFSVDTFAGRTRPARELAPPGHGHPDDAAGRKTILVISPNSGDVMGRPPSRPPRWPGARARSGSCTHGADPTRPRRDPQ